MIYIYILYLRTSGRSCRNEFTIYFWTKFGWDAKMYNAKLCFFEINLSGDRSKQVIVRTLYASFIPFECFGQSAFRSLQVAWSPPGWFQTNSMWQRLRPLDQIGCGSPSIRVPKYSTLVLGWLPVLILSNIYVYMYIYIEFFFVRFI